MSPKKRPNRRQRNKKKHTFVGNMDMSLFVNIARQEPKVWRLFSIINHDFSKIFNRASFSVNFPGIKFEDIVDHKYKTIDHVFCKCGKMMRYFIGGSVDEIYMHSGSTQSQKVPSFFTPNPNMRFDPNTYMVWGGMPVTIHPRIYERAKIRYID